MKTIWYLRDVASNGADFFIWSESEAQIRSELEETLNHYYGASPDDFELGKAVVPNDYSGEYLGETDQ